MPVFRVELLVEDPKSLSVVAAAEDQLLLVPEADCRVALLARIDSARRAFSLRKKIKLVATGLERVLIDEPMDRFEEGEVLVTHAASPHLTPLMLMAGALVVEIGGGASHSSLVARELGLPAVVNAAEAMRVLKEGMEVEVDGTSGTVLLVED